MVLCCVPTCESDSGLRDPTVTFYAFPSWDLAERWTKQINCALKLSNWYPGEKAFICSKHFLHTDFKGDTDILLPYCIPTVFGHRYYGINPESNDSLIKSNSKSPFIVKVIKPQNNVSNDTSGASLNRSETESIKLSGIRNGPNFISQTSSKDNSEPESNVSNEISVTSQSDSKTECISDTRYIPNFISQLSGPSKNNSNQQNVSNSICAPSLDSSGTDCIKISDIRYGPNLISQNSELGKNKSEPPRIINQKIDPVLPSSNSLNSTNIRNNIKRKELSNSLSPKRKLCKKDKNTNDLIEIGPNTFLKINPEVIKVNKKLTPSGNTVLQFIMDKKLADTQSGNCLPQLVQCRLPSSVEEVPAPEYDANRESSSEKTASNKTDKGCGVEHVVGHLVDTHICEESCADLKLHEENGNINGFEKDSMTNNESSAVEKVNESKKVSNGSVSSVLEKAPLLLTTNVPLSHCFMEKPKYILRLKQKTRQIASLKFKISALTKKIEELEDKCIVQERQLSYSFIKRLRTIRKNATKGDPSAAYILEQIHGYSTKSKMRWSESTLTQCAMWCRKAPYAYEYFKKAEFFKLPCLGTVKRFMKKHPEIKYQKKVNNCVPNDDDDESSLDFDFDESDSGNEINDCSDEETNEHDTTKNIVSVPDSTSPATKKGKVADNILNPTTTEGTEKLVSNSSQDQLVHNDVLTENLNSEKSLSTSKSIENIPVTIDGSNIVQEIILPSGEIVQCYSSNVCTGTDVGGQYFIIPNVGDNNPVVDHEYSVVQTDSLPVILQNLETANISSQQEPLIFVANSDQTECNETEISSV